MPKLIHIVLNNFTNDNRVKRAAECGRDQGYEVIIFALASAELKGVQEINGIKVKRFNLWLRSLPKTKGIQVLKYIELFFRMIFSGVIFQPSTVHAHDVDALPIGWVLALLCRSRLIYDAHELWADPAHSAMMPRWLSWSLLHIESFYAKRADVCITVSASIAAYLKKSYELEDVHVVRNVPERWHVKGGKLLRAKFGIPQETVVVLYQGAIGGAGVHTLSKAFRLIGGDVVLVFLGDGPSVPLLRKELKDLGSKVFFHPFVKSSELPLYTSDADIGVHPMSDEYKNHHWALPNKFFEYIQAGLALVVSDLPEMGSVVSEYQVGLTVPAGNVDALVVALQHLVDDRKALDQFKIRSKFAAEQLNWSIERQKLEIIYSQMKK